MTLDAKGEMSTTTDNHIVGFDYLRVAAAFAVVWIHGCDTNKLARLFQLYTAFAVPAFILMSAYLSQRSLAVGSKLTWVALMTKRIRRVIPAYLAWSFLYILLRLAKHRFISHQPMETDWLSVLFCGGASYQLWFVPALVIWTAAFGPLMLWIAGKEADKGTGPAVLAIGVFLLWLGPSVRGFVHVAPGYEILTHMSGSTGFFLIGMGLWVLSVSVTRSASQRKLAGAGTVLTVVALIVQNYFPFEGFIGVYSNGLFIVFLCLSMPKIDVVHKYLAPVAFGIYLCHGIFVEGLQVAANLAGLNLGLFRVTFGVIVLSFTASALLCVLLKSHRHTRWLVI